MSLEVRAAQEDLASVIEAVRSKGVSLWSEQGRLHFKGPHGALTPRDIEVIRTSRASIVAILERETERTPEKLVPLAFSQIAHWHSSHLGNRPAVRVVASVMRLHGYLDASAFQDCVALMVRRHEALRTRIALVDGVPMQLVSHASTGELRVENLTGLSPAGRQAEIDLAIERMVLRPIDLAVDPMWEIRLLKLSEDEHALVVVMEHMISDMHSIGVLLRDMEMAYSQAAAGRPLTLPSVRMQFSEFAQSQREARVLSSTALASQHLTSFGRLAFPVDDTVDSSERSGWATAPLRIGSAVKGALVDWCKLRGTTVVMCVFTAYVATVLRWCEATRTVIRFQSDGRRAAEFESTVGFFATALHVPVELLPQDRFVDLLDRVTREYCLAYESADGSRTVAQTPRPDFTRNTLFNWVPRPMSTHREQPGRSGTLRWVPVDFNHPLCRALDVDMEPSVLLFDCGEEIRGDVYFPRERFSDATMSCFVENFLRLLHAMLKAPETSPASYPILRWPR